MQANRSKLLYYTHADELVPNIASTPRLQHERVLAQDGKAQLNVVASQLAELSAQITANKRAGGGRCGSVVMNN